jgi:methylenetetrahydrofolate reductase (NADPH)
MAPAGEGQRIFVAADQPPPVATCPGKFAAANGEPKPSVSFEFFPAKSAAAEAQLWQTIDRLAAVAPAFVSVTYGAGGTTRDHTHATVLRIRRETPLEPAAHLTCIGACRQETDDIALRYWEAGIRRIVALRGDLPTNAGALDPTGYAFAADLVAGLCRIAPFDISVAAYPETHPEAQSAAADLDNLKRKLDAGAERAITQFFLDPAIYLRFRDRARVEGVRAPIVPGVLSITDFGRVASFAARCGASVPPWLAQRFAGLENDLEAQRRVAAAAVIDLCHTLRSEGVHEFHFYTLNRAEVSLAVCSALGLSTVSSTVCEG